VLLAVAALALLAWPWSNQQIQDLRERYQGRGDIERVAPGRFIESAGGQRVFFIDKDTAEADSGTNIFIAASERGSEAVISAERGRLVAQGEGARCSWTRAFACRPTSRPAPCA
jgi:lipopolysaccharide export system permease protein